MGKIKVDVPSWKRLTNFKTRKKPKQLDDKEQLIYQMLISLTTHQHFSDLTPWKVYSHFVKIVRSDKRMAIKMRKVLDDMDLEKELETITKVG